MSEFAIVRHNKKVDIAEGSSVADVANRYGWPGNGTIEPFDPDTHKKVRYTFASPDEQREALTDKPTGEIPATSEEGA